MKGLFFFGFVFFIGTFFLLPYALTEYKVDKYGQIGKMKIEKIPFSCIGSKVEYFVYVSYNGAIYDFKTSGDFCERHKVGDIIDIKYLEGNKTILLPHESGLFELFSLAALNIFGLAMIISQGKKIFIDK